MVSPTHGLISCASSSTVYLFWIFSARRYWTASLCASVLLVTSVAPLSRIHSRIPGACELNSKIPDIGSMIGCDVEPWMIADSHNPSSLSFTRLE